MKYSQQGFANLILIVLVLMAVSIVGLGAWWIASRPAKVATDQKPGTAVNDAPEQNNSADNTPQPANQPTMPVPAAAPGSGETDRMYTMQGRLTAYMAMKRQYPPGTAEGWNLFVQFVKDPQSITDPETGQVLRFTTNDPQAGEIQYRSPASCAADGVAFADARTDKSYAFRLNKYGKTFCVTSL